MKKIIVLGIIVLMVTGVAFAETKKKQTTTQQQVTITQTPTAKLEEIIAKKKAELNGTEWTVEMKPMGGKGKAETDVISFAEDKVSSKNLSNAGYPATNFTVRLEEDGTVIWETMQTSEKDGQAFWRGDIGPDGIMRGVLSKRDTKGNTVDFNFVSVSK